MMILVQKQLSPCPTGQRAAAVERMVIPRSILKEATAVFAEFLPQETAVYFFE